MKASSGVLLAAMAVASLAATALATDYIVGGSDLWDTYIDYDQWVAGKTFMVGDTITFRYEPYHNVLEVTEADYASCSPDNPVSTDSGGKTTFELAATGTRYFICGIPRHCLNGTMHVKITTVPYDAAAAAAANAAATPSSAPLSSPPADSFAPAPAGYKVAMDVEGKSPTGAPSNAPRYQQPAAAVAGLALAALVALAA
ncbi:blue copper protein-like [Phragmites australis]|uniref:blue copper protein-like n=1 Tax=Phragmites australis TaxID=29695 RepID=UPI002D7A250C|nr:blue copper protein-like [Phragmites australis]